jgi:hypothetical protein
MIRALGLIPTEYLYFYYAQRQALRNQVRADPREAPTSSV